MRERFTYRGDSLWWFAELYLHKERQVLACFRALHAARAVLEREAPDGIHVHEPGSITALVLSQLAHASGIGYEESASARAPARPSRIRKELSSAALMLAAVASPARPLRVPSVSACTVGAFVHRAFWGAGRDSGDAEAYIGPVLGALERKLPAGAIRFIGVGPSTNFRARRWWRRPATPQDVTPIETLVPRRALAEAIDLWTERHAIRRALRSSADLRAAAIIDGCDLFPVLADALDGIALLQFPWSARAMDESGAALDATEPAVVLTYAEAGGWGRALVLEARRRGIPVAGLQHGFIYRHWLNYRHEPDEMGPPAPGSSDAGFPRPDLTLVFDEYAAAHLRDAGRFPPSSVAVTGSPRLDALAAAVRALGPEDVHGARVLSGAAGAGPLVLLVTKYSEVRSAFRGLLEAIRAVPDAHLAIKAHPAETPEPYEREAAGIPNVRVLPASAPLAPLIRASRAVVTVNSTVALDALSLGVPALSIGLPNNLSPFVEAGAMAGASGPDEITGALRRLLYDDEFRRRLSAAAAALVREWRMAPDGAAADRAAAAVMALARGGHGATTRGPHGHPVAQE